MTDFAPTIMDVDFDADLGKTRQRMFRERLGQRELALDLRYLIDIARRTEASDAVERIRLLIAEHPHGAASRHIHHNIGKERLAWLDAQGITLSKEE